MSNRWSCKAVPPVRPQAQSTRFADLVDRGTRREVPDRCQRRTVDRPRHHRMDPCHRGTGNRPRSRSAGTRSQESLAGTGVERETHKLPGFRLTANQPVIARIVSVPPGHARTASAGAAGRGHDGDIGAVTGDADGITAAGFIKATSATFVRAAVRGAVVTTAIPGTNEERVGSLTLVVSSTGIAGTTSAVMSRRAGCVAAAQPQCRYAAHQPAQ
jgi:hypothetical protein